MKKYSIIILALFLSACATTPTPNPAEIGLTMFADKVKAEATQASVNSVYTATAQVYAVTATYQAVGTQEAVTAQARQDAEATAQQERADAQATADQRRVDAQATQQRIDADATQAQARRDMEIQATQMRLDIESTQQAQATANAFMMTQAVMPTHNLWTQQAVEQQIIIGTNEVALSNLEVEQQKQTNTVEWVVPFLIAFGLAAAAVVYILRYSRAREYRDDDGNVQVILLDNEKAIRPDRFTGPVLDIKGMKMPLLAPPAEQAEVTKRAQMVDAIKAMPATTSNNAASAFNSAFTSSQTEPPYDIVDAVPAGLLDGEALKSIEKDWKEATDG